MTLGDELRDWSLMECPCDQQDDVVDHVAVSDKVEEGRQWLVGVISHVLELDHQFLAQFVIDDRHGERRRLVCQKLSIISALKMKFQI